MTNSRSTKSALFTSVVAILLCCTMLLGTTFAWFTDTAQSSGNKIQAGTLDVDLLVYDENSTAADKFDSVANSTEPIFNYTLWEPGYTQVETMKIANLGNLALKYQLNVVAKDVDTTAVHNLADVIDVYMAFGQQTPTKFADITEANGWWKCGTLAQLMDNPNGFTQGKLLPKDADTTGITLGGENGILVGDVTTTIALHMQESAGNEYQNLSLGNVDINLVATQWTYEADNFDNQYDADASLDGIVASKPLASVTASTEKEVKAVNFEDWNNPYDLKLDVAYQFLPTQTAEQAENHPYEWWNADFVISADKDVELKNIALAGYYSIFGDLITDGSWVVLRSDSGTVNAGEEVRLVEYMGSYVNYKELCRYSFEDLEGNPITNPADQGFLCGVADVSGTNALAGTTITVELRMYEVENADSDSGSHPEKVDGESFTVATYKYTFK